MENLNQVVFVVVDKEEEKVLGVFNEYEDAKRVALKLVHAYYDGTEISITPVLVDRMNWGEDTRQLWLNEAEVVDALQEEIDLASPDEAWEEEEEEKDEEECSPCDDCEYPDCENCDLYEGYEEEEEEEEEKTDPIEAMVYTGSNGRRVISEKDALDIIRLSEDVLMHQHGYDPDTAHEKAKGILMKIANVYHIWGVEKGE